MKNWILRHVSLFLALIILPFTFPVRAESISEFKDPVAIMYRSTETNQVEFFICDLSLMEEVASHGFAPNDPNSNSSDESKLGLINNISQMDVSEILSRPLLQLRGLCVPAFEGKSSFSLTDLEFHPIWRKVSSTLNFIWETLAGYGVVLAIANASGPVWAFCLGWGLAIIGVVVSSITVGVTYLLTGDDMSFKDFNPIYTWSKANIADKIHADNFTDIDGSEPIILESGEDLDDFLHKVARILNTKYQSIYKDESLNIWDNLSP